LRFCAARHRRDAFTAGPVKSDARGEQQTDTNSAANRADVKRLLLANQTRFLMIFGGDAGSP
jgi:hypothetical protein